MANQHNLACPMCKSPDEVFITITMKVEGMLMEDGVDYDCGGDFDWLPADPAKCDKCGWTGKAGFLIELEPGDEGYYEEGE